MYNGRDGQGTVNKVNNISPDSDNNVSLVASNIPSGSNSNVQSDLDAKQDKILPVGMLKGAGSGAVNAATLGTDYGALAFTVTLSSSGWSHNVQTISDVRFVASGYAYMVSPSTASASDAMEAIILGNNITTNGQMTFTCVNVPSNNITMNVVRMVSA